MRGMRLSWLVVVCLGVIGVLAWRQAGSDDLHAWEHGWDTSHVRATRYRNDVMGYTIGFLFPRNCADADRKELFDFLEAQGAHVFQGGGAPCAEMLMTFHDVTTRAEADAKLQSLLPRLNAFMRQMTW